MKYYLDTEFNGFMGNLISIALVREDQKSLYLINNEYQIFDPWVEENVIPILTDVPGYIKPITCSKKEMSKYIEDFLGSDDSPQIITDWPDDIRYLCELLITGPGYMIKSAKKIDFQIVRVNAYPTLAADAVQHNAWWDAVALLLYLNNVRVHN